MENFSSMDLTLFLQEMSGPVILPLQVISLLGQPEVYLLILPAIYWLYDPRLGIRLMVLICCTGWSNDLLKQVLHLPRPYWLSHQVRMLDLAESASFGFPSGHSQIPASYLGLVAYWVRKWYVWLIFLLLIFCIGISRVCLGVHFPTDVIGGWSLGILMLLLFILLDLKYSAFVSSLPGYVIMLSGFLASTVMFYLSCSTTTGLAPVLISGVWGGELFGTLTGAAYISNHAGLTTAGMLSGAVCGWVLIHNSAEILVSCPIKIRIIRFISGMTILVLFYLSIGFSLSIAGEDIRPFLIWMRGIILGGWITGGAPWLFEVAGQYAKYNEKNIKKS